MSRLTEYMPELTGVVFAEEDEKDNTYLEVLRGLRSGTSTTGGTTTTKPDEKDYYTQRSEDNRGKPGIHTLEELQSMYPGARYLNSATIMAPTGERYTLQAGTGDWQVTSSAFTSKDDQNRFNQGKPIGGGSAGGPPGYGTPAAPGGYGGNANAANAGAYAGSLTGNAPPTPAGTGGFRPGTAGSLGTLPSSAGVTLPGMGAFNIPGLGVEQEGRRTLYDNNGLNTMYANRPNGPQILGTPTGGGGRTGMTWTGGGGSSVTPSMQFPGAAVSVPDSYQQGVGNVGPMGAITPFSAPYNIGPGGAGLMNIAGSNVQLNSADKSVGMGFALTPQTPSERFAATDFGSATGRTLNSDPALQAAQTLQLITALNSMGGGSPAIDALTSAERNQYSGISKPSAQGTWFSGAAPGPQMTPNQAPAPAAPAPNPLLSNVAGSTLGTSAASNAIANGGNAWNLNNGLQSGNRPAGASLTMGNPWSGDGGTGAGGTLSMGNPWSGGAGPGTQAGTAGIYTGNPLVSAPAVAPPVAPPPVAAAPPGGLTSVQLAAALAELQREEEERGMGGGGGEGGGGGRPMFPGGEGFSRGGVVNTMGRLPGFADGGSVDISQMGWTGDPNAKPARQPGYVLYGSATGGNGYWGAPPSPTSAAPADTALGGSLTPGAGAAVNTSQTPSVNPAENAIQPVSSPQNQTTVTPTGVASQAPVPDTAGALDPFYAAQQKNAMRERLRTQTYGNRWQAAGLSAPTAVQLQPGQQLPQGGLPPGVYYSNAEALQRFIDQISGRQTQLAGLGPIGDPNELMSRITTYQGQQMPYKQAMDIRLQLAGLGASGQGDLTALSQQREALQQRMSPLQQIQALRTKLESLGKPYGIDELVASADNRSIEQLMNEIKRAEQVGGPYGLDPTDHLIEGGYMDSFGEWHNDPSPAYQATAANIEEMKRQFSTLMAHNKEIEDAQAAYNNLLASSGYGDASWQPAGSAPRLDAGSLDAQMGSLAAQEDALKQAYAAAQTGEGYRNQIQSLIGGQDPVAEYARYQEMINQSQEAYGNVEKARILAREIQNLAQAGATLPGFAKGGNWIAGATKNAHGQFRNKAKAAGMSTRAYAAKMSDAPGRTGKQARLAKSLMGFAAGGTMTTEEPIIGIGMFTGQPRFQVGEPQYPGGPPMAERLKIEPLNKPSLPLGGMRRAA